MTNIYPHPSYREKVLSKKPSAHTLSSFEKLDAHLSTISQKLSAGAHPIDIFIPQKLKQSDGDFSLAQSLMVDFDSTLMKQSDYHDLGKIPKDTLARQYELIKQKSYQTDSPAEATIKRHSLLGETLRDIYKNLFPNWMKKAHEQRKQYKPENNGLYPLRLSNGEPLGIAKIDPTGHTASGAVYSAKQVHPFISKKKSQEERAALYDQVQCRPITQVRNPLESALIGQDGVFATRFIPKGTCLGVYGGCVFPNLPLDDLPAQLALLDTNLMALSAKNQPSLMIDGDTIISKINTTFVYDRKGQPKDQAPLSDYNAERADFEVELVNKTKTDIATLFTTKNIQPGEEIRYSYGYSPDIVQKKFKT